MRLVVNVGGMFSGKTTELQRQGKRHLLAGHNVVFVKPKMDDRYSEDFIVTHDGARVEAINVEGSLLDDERIMGADVVLIDEVQFLSDCVVNNIECLVRDGKIIYVSGLDMDYNGVEFPVVARLMAKADEVNKFKSVCEKCGQDSTFTAKRKDNGDLIELGSSDLYMPLCRSCYYVHRGWKEAVSKDVDKEVEDYKTKIRGVSLENTLLKSTVYVLENKVKVKDCRIHELERKAKRLERAVVDTYKMKDIREVIDKKGKGE